MKVRSCSNAYDLYPHSWNHDMNKNMQISKLLIPKFVIENNCNIQSVFDLLQHCDKKNHDQTAVMANDNYVSVQQLNYHIGCDNDDDGVDSYPLSTNDLRNNDKKILSILNEEMWSTYSFKALERKLDIHQQSLARALKRLVDLDLIEKTPAGYKLIKKNIFLSNTILQNRQLTEEEAEEAEPELFETGKTRKRFNQLIQMRIPIRNNTELVVNQLVGKWFGSLRWFGLIKKETGVTLQWVAINKYSNNKLFQINVNIVSEYIVMESNAVSEKEKIEAMSCSNRIVGEITKILQGDLQQECEIPDEFTVPKNHVPTYTSKVKRNFKGNN
jgi:DNA-binding HxlR family transcriptional regulator